MVRRRDQVRIVRLPVDGEHPRVEGLYQPTGLANIQLARRNDICYEDVN